VVDQKTSIERSSIIAACLFFITKGQGDDIIDAASG